MTAFGFRCLRLVAVAIVGLTSSTAGFRVVVPPSTALDLGRGVPAASASNVASAGRAPLTAALVVDDSASPSEDGVGFRALGAGGSDGPSQLQDVEMPSARDVSRASPGAVVAPLSCSASGVDLERIKTLLPHRFPFLLVDRVLCATPEKALGLKLVTANEDFFNGHFPQRAIMPGVLQVLILGCALPRSQTNAGDHADWCVVTGGELLRRWRRWLSCQV